jgi:hypothetical protein
MTEKVERTKVEEEQYGAKSESIRKQLNQNLGQLFEAIHIGENAYQTTLVFDKKHGLIEKAFEIPQTDRSIFEDVLPDEICDILFEKNEQSSFSVSISRKKHMDEDEFSLTIMSNTKNDLLADKEYIKTSHNRFGLEKESKIEEAQATCNPTADLNIPFITITNRGSAEFVSRLAIENINLEKYYCLGLIEVARTLADMKGFIK